MSGKKIAVIIIIIAAAAAGLVWYFFGRGSKAVSEDAVYVQPVRYTDSGASTIRYSGIVETQKTSKVEFDSERKLDELFVSVGDIVKEGDDLFSYDTEPILLEIEKLRLEVDKMNAEISHNNDQINEHNALLEKTPDADKPELLAQIRELQTENAELEYDIKTKESEIKQKEAQINDSVVKAKMAGIVEKIADAQDIIDGKNVGEDGMSDNTFILIRAEGDYRVKGKTDEQSIKSLRQGMEVIIRSRIDDKIWGGTVSIIDTQSTVNSEDSDYYYGDDSESASKYAFYVELDSTEDILLGQHVLIEPGSVYAKEKSGIWLPAGFIVQDGGTLYVWAAKDENSLLEKRSITTGDYDENTDTYRITSGLAENDLIAWPDSDCREGAPVTTQKTVDENDTYSDDEDNGDSDTDDTYYDDSDTDDTYYDDSDTDDIYDSPEIEELG